MTQQHNPTEEEIAILRKLWRTATPVDEIAKRLNLTLSQLRGLRIKLNLSPRNRR